MEQVWPWLTTLSSSLSVDSSALSLPLASDANKSILLQAQETTSKDNSHAVTFSISLLGFNNPSSKPITLWVCNPLPLSSSSYTSIHYQLLVQLAQEIITLAPSEQLTTPPSLETGPISEVLDGTHQSTPSFFTLLLLCRLFWLCSVDGPSDAGSLFFHTVAGLTNIILTNSRPAMRSFLITIGIDWEERLMRSIGYMLTKYCILQELQAGPADSPPPPIGFCPSYIVSSHGLWILRGYAPISAMNLVRSGTVEKFNVKDSVLRYTLGHQQLEAVVQLEYHVSIQDSRFISINVRANNVRLYVTRLEFGKKEIEDNGERHFPSRVRIWVGPEIGSSYATGLSLGLSTRNPEREIETVKVVKENYNFGRSSKSRNIPSVKVKTRTSVKSRAKNWVWEHAAEGNVGVFEGVLYNEATGLEVSTSDGEIGMMMRKNSGVSKVFSKGGGVVVGRDEVGEGVGWRVGREMEGKVVKWRVGGRVWVSYHPNEVNSRYFETRCVEWRETVDLPLVCY